MIGVIIILMVCITIGIIVNIWYNREMNKINELKKKLDEYYRKREENLMKHNKH